MIISLLTSLKYLEKSSDPQKYHITVFINFCSTETWKEVFKGVQNVLCNHGKLPKKFETNLKKMLNQLKTYGNYNITTISKNTENKNQLLK